MECNAESLNDDYNAPLLPLHACFACSLQPVGPSSMTRRDAPHTTRARASSNTSFSHHHHRSSHAHSPLSPHIRTAMQNVKCPCYMVSEGKGHYVARHKTREGHHEKDVKLVASLRAKGETVPKPLLAAVKKNGVISAGKGRSIWVLSPSAVPAGAPRREYHAARCVDELIRPSTSSSHMP